jgi:hypothetical protein
MIIVKRGFLKSAEMLAGKHRRVQTNARKRIGFIFFLLEAKGTRLIYGMPADKSRGSYDKPSLRLSGPSGSASYGGYFPANLTLAM